MTWTCFCWVRRTKYVQKSLKNWMHGTLWIFISFSKHSSRERLQIKRTDCHSIFLFQKLYFIALILGRRSTLLVTASKSSCQLSRVKDLDSSSTWFWIANCKLQRTTGLVGLFIFLYRNISRAKKLQSISRTFLTKIVFNTACFMSSFNQRLIHNEYTIIRNILPIWTCQEKEQSTGRDYANKEILKTKQRVFSERLRVGWDKDQVQR